ncbi:hypothetical protein ACLIA0_02185 [Bacillaceae bacterium W0354]
MKRLVFAMILLSTILLLYQWMMFAEQKENTTTKDKPIVVANLVEKHEEIDVNVKVSNLSGDNYEMHIPTIARSLICEDINGEPCSIKDDTLTIHDINTINFSYQLPKSEGELIFYTDWLVTFNQIEDINITVSISGLKNDNEHWVSIKKPIFTEDLSNITYSEWEFDLDKPIVIAKLPNDYRTTSNYGNIQIYSSIPVDINDLSFMEPFKDKHHLIIISPNHAEVYEQGLTVINHIEKRKMASALLSSHLLTRTIVNQENEILLDVVNSYYYAFEKDKDIQKMVDQLHRALDENEKQAWFDELMKWNQRHVDLVSMLDQTLQNVLNINTFFFSNNLSSDEIIPVFGFDHRVVKLNDQPQDISWKNIIYQDDLYIPIAGLAELTGLSIIGFNDGQELFIEFKSNRYRFFLNDGLFIVNEENYHTKDNAIINIAGEIYIHIPLATEIFPFEISVHEKYLNIEL